MDFLFRVNYIIQDLIIFNGKENLLYSIKQIYSDSTEDI
jgi:hypothetical protein